MAKKDKLPYHIILTTYYDDGGHGDIDEHILVRTNVRSKELYQAYIDGCRKTNVHLDSLSAYDLHVEDLEILKKHGFDDSIFDETQLEFDEEYISPVGADQFIEIYFFVAKLGNKKVEYELVESNVETMDI